VLLYVLCGSSHYYGYRPGGYTHKWCISCSRKATVNGSRAAIIYITFGVREFRIYRRVDGLKSFLSPSHCGLYFKGTSLSDRFFLASTRNNILVGLLAVFYHSKWRAYSYTRIKAIESSKLTPPSCLKPLGFSRCSSIPFLDL
jgi:hypothetical protein